MHEVATVTIRVRRRWYETAAALLLALAATGCQRTGDDPSAPFGGPLATSLPHRDIFGLYRFVPGGAGDPALVFGEEAVDAARNVSILGPLIAVLDAQRDHPFVAPGAPLVVWFLDPDVHGGLAGFTWSGTAEGFRAAARAQRWTMPEDDLVELPGRAGSDWFQMALDGVRRGMGAPRRNRSESGTIIIHDGRRLEMDGEEEPDEESLPVPIASAEGTPRMRYHLLEQEGVVLLLPAKDGRRNVSESLAATHALDPATGTGPLLRFDFGRCVQRVRGAISDASYFMINNLASRLFPEQMGDRQRWQWQEDAVQRVRAVLDAGESIEHLTLIADAEGGIDLFLKARTEGFFDRLLLVVENRSLEELLADAPEATLLLAVSVVPDMIPEVPTLWRESTASFLKRLKRGSARRAQRFETVAEPAVDMEPQFLSSFTGRAWLALLTDGASAATRPELSDGSQEGNPGQPIDLGALLGDANLAVLAEMEDDEAPHGLVWTMLHEVLPDSAQQVLALLGLKTFRERRLTQPRATFEVIGMEPGERMQSEVARIQQGDHALPFFGAPATAFLLLQGDLAGDRIGLALAQEVGGLHATLRGRPR